LRYCLWPPDSLIPLSPTIVSNFPEILR
jgi:hypothetical protein